MLMSRKKYTWNRHNLSSPIPGAWIRVSPSWASLPAKSLGRKGKKGGNGGPVMGFPFRMESRAVRFFISSTQYWTWAM